MKITGPQLRPLANLLNQCDKLGVVPDYIQNDTRTLGQINVLTREGSGLRRYEISPAGTLTVVRY